MRKNTSFAIAATMMAFAVTFWAKSSVVATSADIAGPGFSSTVVTAGPNLLNQRLEPIW